MYASKKKLGEMFDLSPTTVWRKVKGIEREVGKRYNRYAVADNRISAEVFVDYLKYEERLHDKNTRKSVPAFDMIAAGAYLDDWRGEHESEGKDS